MAAIFGVEELTGRAFNINSETFRSVEIFSLTALVYIVITFIATFLLALIGFNFVTEELFRGKRIVNLILKGFLIFYTLIFPFTSNPAARAFFSLSEFSLSPTVTLAPESFKFMACAWPCEPKPIMET